MPTRITTVRLVYMAAVSLLLSFVHLIIMIVAAAIALQIALVFSDSSWFIIYFACVALIIFLLTTVMWAKIPFLSSQVSRSAQDGALLIAGLVALAGILDVETTFIDQVETQINGYLVAPIAFTLNVNSDEKKECKAKPQPDICAFYVEAYDIAKSQGTSDQQWKIEFQHTEQLSILFQRLVDRYKLGQEPGADKITDFDDELKLHTDLTDNQRTFIRQIAILGGPLQAAWSPYQRVRNDVIWVKNHTGTDNAKLFGLFFIIISFSLLFIRRLVVPQSTDVVGAAG
jgi:hypothetical protein